MMVLFQAQVGTDVVSALLNNAWFILFILLFLIPMAQRNYLQGARKRVLAKLGKSRGTQVITLIHRQETISFLGIPSGPVHRYRRQRTGFEGHSQS